jgi:hypothetical protein
MFSVIPAQICDAFGIALIMLGVILIDYVAAPSYRHASHGTENVLSIVARVR